MPDDRTRLVLTRRHGQAIVIGTDRSIRVELRNRVTRQGEIHFTLVITAPREVPIWREELLLPKPEEGEPTHEI